ncbi:hypothetical protein [Streptomyces sp. NPDC002851]
MKRVTVRGPGVRVVVAVGVVLVASGCGGERSGADGGGARSGGIPVVTSHQQAQELPELPLAADRFQYSAREQRQIEEAEALLAQACMRRRGHEDFPKYPGNDMGNTVLTMVSSDGNFALTDPARARRWGYGNDPAKVREWRESYEEKRRARQGRPLRPDERRDYDGLSERTTGDGKRPGGCVDAAHARLARGVADAKNDAFRTYASNRQYQVWRAAERRPELKKAFRDWAACLKTKGVRAYRTPNEPYQDKRWADRDGARGVRTAVADVACKFEHNTVGIWWSVLDRSERADLARHKERYERAARDMATYLANARTVLTS